MRKHKKALIALATIAVAIAAGIGWLSQPAGATDEPQLVVLPCDNDNVDCGSFPDPEDVPEGTPCKIYFEGEWLEGEVNDEGQCVCPEDEEPTTTTTTVPETTTTTQVPVTTTTPPTTATTEPEPPTFANCAEAIAAGEAPIAAENPGYAPNLDSDGDGIACESDQVNPPRTGTPRPATPVVVSPDFTG